MRLKLMALNLALVAAVAACQTKPETKENVNPAATQASAAQRSFASPDGAVAALMAAVKNEDHSMLNELFGPATEELISPDKVQADNAFKSFVAKAAEKIRQDTEKKDVVILYIGNEDWPFPIPLVKGKDGKWFFDTEAGKTEILARRIGADELETINVCKAVVAAEWEYGKQAHGTDVPAYAQRFMSHEGTHDGLYWKAADNQQQSPLGPLMAAAEQEGYSDQSHTPKSGDPLNGYYFRILKQQGPAAPGGAYNYVINGNMIAGFALIASPAEYGKTGVMTFIVCHNGKVFEKDLGPKTTTAAGKIVAFNPDSSWHAVE